MGCDVIEAQTNGFSTFVSIHTSLWDVTPVPEQDHRSDPVSIHTSLWDVTHLVLARVVCDDTVSIHTSLWDVTLQLKLCLSPGGCFNPHIPMGCDVLFSEELTADRLFQSTHPYGM